MNSAFLILAHMAEGCTEQIKKNLQNPIMNEFIPLGLKHPAQGPKTKSGPRAGLKKKKTCGPRTTKCART